MQILLSSSFIVLVSGFLFYLLVISTWSYDRLLSSVRGTHPTQPQVQIFISMSGELERVELELHSAALAGLCRICGGRLSNHRVTYECTEHTNGLMGAFLVDISQDKPDVHPARFCNNCYRAYRQHEKMESEGKDYNCSIQVPQWNEHTTNCDRCNKFTNSKKGGRPKKATKNRGRPKHTEAEDNVTRAGIKYQIRSLAGPQYKATMPLSPVRFVSLISLKTLVCPICKCTVDQPVETDAVTCSVPYVSAAFWIS